MRDFWEITAVSIFSVFNEIAGAFLGLSYDRLLQMLFVTSIESWNLLGLLYQ